MSLASMASVRADWFGVEASRLARAIDAQFELLWILGVLLLLGGFLAFTIALMRRGDAREGASVDERASVAGPVLAGLFGAVLAVLVFLGGWQVYVDASVTPAYARVVDAVGGTDGWRFVYAPDVESTELHLPVDAPVQLRLRADSTSVRLGVPELRLAATVWADRPVDTWVQATRTGAYAIWGTGIETASADSGAARVVVHTPEEFQGWLDSVSSVVDRLPPVEAGLVLVTRNGCLVCHSTDGSPKTGPSFQGVIGRARVFIDGGTAVADSAYVHRSILEPQAQVVDGFQPVMPSFAGKLGDREIAAILAWFASLVPVQEEGR